MVLDIPRRAVMDLDVDLQPVAVAEGEESVDPLDVGVVQFYSHPQDLYGAFEDDGWEALLVPFLGEAEDELGV